MELKKAIKHSINIEPSSNMGFIVKIGCGTFTYQSRSDLVEDLKNYLENPDKFEEEYNKNCGGTDAVAVEPSIEVERRPEGRRDPARR